MTTKYDQFNQLKKQNSPWLTIDDGETVKVTSLRSMKAMEKPDPKTGQINAVMHIELDIQTEDGIKMKTMDTGSSRLINVFEENGIDIGSSFLLKKIGEKFDTRYEVSEVKNQPIGGVSTQQSTGLTDEEADAAMEGIVDAE